MGFSEERLIQKDGGMGVGGETSRKPKVDVDAWKKKWC